MQETHLQKGFARPHSSPALLEACSWTLVSIDVCRSRGPTPATRAEAVAWRCDVEECQIKSRLFLGLVLEGMFRGILGVLVRCLTRAHVVEDATHPMPSQAQEPLSFSLVAIRHKLDGEQTGL